MWEAGRIGHIAIIAKTMGQMFLVGHTKSGNFGNPQGSEFFTVFKNERRIWEGTGKYEVVS